MSERMERKKRQKRNTIIDKAERAIAKKGYWDMTMDEVAEDADVAKGTIYLYFNSKEALCAAVIARIIADMNQSILERLNGVQGGLTRIRATVSAVIEWNAIHPEKSMVLNNVMSMRFKDTSDPNVQEYIGQMDAQLQIMRENYEMAIAEGSARPDLDPLPAVIFIRMAFWVAMNPFSSHEIIMTQNGIDRETFVSTALDLIAHATRTSEEKPRVSATTPKRVKAKS